MQDRPDARELIAAVESFIGRELLPTLTDPRLRFRALVAANVLTIVARELAWGEEQLRAEWGRLTPLLGGTDIEIPATVDELRKSVWSLNRELCARIRVGEADAGPWRAEVLAHVQATVVDKLRVANPRYLERVLEEGAKAQSGESRP